MQILVKMFTLIWQAEGISLIKRLNCYWWDHHFHRLHELALPPYTIPWHRHVLDLRFFLRYVLFAAITLGVVSVPPIILWVDEWRCGRPGE